MTTVVRIAVAGLGTVGAGVIDLLQRNADLLASRSGRSLKIVAVSARDRRKKRPVDVSSYAWVEHPLDLVTRDDVDVIVEAMGGAEGVALDLARQALSYGKHLVTANKAMLAMHGRALSALAERNQVSLLYDAAVGGAIPSVQTVLGGLSANAFSGFCGVLNGTCNYILSRLEQETPGFSFSHALKDAQAKGYAEADPSADIDGHDTAHKITLMAAVGFGILPTLGATSITGIHALDTVDMQMAKGAGYRIRLLAEARRLGEETFLQSVYPACLPESHPLATLNGNANGLEMRGDFSGAVFLSGAGAGGRQTASAVVADILLLARGFRPYPFGVPSRYLTQATFVPLDDQRFGYYVRAAATIPLTALSTAMPVTKTWTSRDARHHGAWIAPVRECDFLAVWDTVRHSASGNTATSEAIFVRVRDDLTPSEC